MESQHGNPYKLSEIYQTCIEIEKDANTFDQYLLLLYGGVGAEGS